MSDGPAGPGPNELESLGSPSLRDLVRRLGAIGRYEEPEVATVDDFDQRVRIIVQEIIDAESPEGITHAELIEAVGLSDRVLDEQLTALWSSGEIERVREPGRTSAVWRRRSTVVEEPSWSGDSGPEPEPADEDAPNGR